MSDLDLLSPVDRHAVLAAMTPADLRRELSLTLDDAEMWRTRAINAEARLEQGARTVHDQVACAVAAALRDRAFAGDQLAYAQGLCHAAANIGAWDEATATLYRARIAEAIDLAFPAKVAA